jgi:ParB-like chromosome segregation protein Spo0J
MEFHPDVIEVTDRVRDLDDAKVAELAGSIAAIGQIAPIVVFSTELADRIILVAGWR